MPIVITINQFPSTVAGNDTIYDYSDRIVEREDGYHDVYYSGQNQGAKDYQLIDCIENEERFIIYHRQKKNMPFTLLGYTSTANVVKTRQVPKGIDASPKDKLQLHMVVRNNLNIRVPENKFKGSGKYKKDVLVHSGLRNTNNESIIEHDGNNNIGFYYYHDDDRDEAVQEKEDEESLDDIIEECFPFEELMGC